jgi:actin-related protein 5
MVYYSIELTLSFTIRNVMLRPLALNHESRTAGSCTFRAGFSSHSQPYIIEPNQTSKYRHSKTTANPTSNIQLHFGTACDHSASSRAATKGVWDGDLLVGVDGLEVALDYSLNALRRFSPGPKGLDGGPFVPHPVIMTERLGTPLHSRSLTSELLFEGYGVPSVCYGVDGLWGWYGRMGEGASSAGSSSAPVSAGGTNSKRRKSTQGNSDVKMGETAPTSDGLVINMGHYSTTLIPVLSGRGLVERAKR